MGTAGDAPLGSGCCLVKSPVLDRNVGTSSSWVAWTAPLVGSAVNWSCSEGLAATAALVGRGGLVAGESVDSVPVLVDTVMVAIVSLGAVVYVGSATLVGDTIGGVSVAVVSIDAAVLVDGATILALAGGGVESEGEEDRSATTAP